MPLIKSTYRAPVFLPGGTLQTVIPGRKPRKQIVYERETLELPDGDFLDLDWIRNGSERLIILTHGLEGSSKSQYVSDTVNQMDHEKFDLLAWNCRSCSGRMNRLPKLYHHGEIEDISEVVRHVLSLDRYRSIHLAGFSMGGNITIKFLARKKELARHISSSAVISTPFDLESSSATLDKPKNYLLRKYFMKNLYVKLGAKEAQFPGSFPMEKFHDVKTWNEFDRLFVAPFVGFDSVDVFYREASANTFILDVESPVFIINAKNDPVLTRSCHPIEPARSKSHIHFELSRTGGHVYFPMKKKNYAVRRMIEFFESDLPD